MDKLLNKILKSRELIIKEFGVDSCVRSTSIAIRAAQHFGLELKPLHVDAIVYNPWLTKQFLIALSNKQSINIPELVNHKKGWNVGLKGEPISHLVAAGSGYFIDLSIYIFF